MYNKQRRKHDQRNNKSRIPSWWREERRGKENCHQIPASQNTGDAAGSPSLLDYGPEVHRDRILGHPKSSRKRSSRRVCLELIQLAPFRGLATSHPSQATSVKQQAASYKHQAASVKLQAFKIIVDKF